MEPLSFGLGITVAFFCLASGGIMLPIWVVAWLVLR